MFNVLTRLTSPRTTLGWGELLFHLLGRRRSETFYNVSQAKNLLVIRTDEIGDFVLFTSFLRELRRNAPDAYITLVVKPEIYNLAEFCPYVDKVFSFQGKVTGKLWPLRRHWKAFLFARRYLWPCRFDLVLLPRWDIDWNHATFLAYFSGVLSRVAYSEAVSPEKQSANQDYDLLVTRIVSCNAEVHEVEKNLHFLRCLNATVGQDDLELWMEGSDYRNAESLLQEHLTNSESPVIALGIGASAKRRLWPIASYIELGRWLQHEYNATLVLVGAKSDKLLGETLCAHLERQVVSAIDRLTLRESAAVLSKCHLFIGNDSGPSHIAAAMRTPTIQISCHPTDGSPNHVSSPQRFRPHNANSKVIQPLNPVSPCQDYCQSDEAHCITAVSFFQVQDAVREMLPKPEFDQPARLRTAIR